MEITPTDGWNGTVTIQHENGTKYLLELDRVSAEVVFDSVDVQADPRLTITEAWITVPTKELSLSGRITNWSIQNG